MKRAMLLFAGLAAFAGIGCSSLGIYRFSPKEKMALAVIREVKEFEKTIGFSPTSNFESFDASVSYKQVSYIKKRDIPFSYQDKNFHSKPADGKEGTDAVESAKSDMARSGADPSKYEFVFSNIEAASGGTIITPALLNDLPARLVYAVIHEDWHDNVSLPVHIEEASGEVIGRAGSFQFLGLTGETWSMLQKRLAFSLEVNCTHVELSSLSEMYKKGWFTDAEYDAAEERSLSAFKERIAKIAPEELLRPWNATAIVRMHAYTRYFPLMCRLFRACGGDIAKMVEVLKNVPFRDPPYSLCDTGEGATPCVDEAHLDAVKTVEGQIEEYLEKIIGKQ